MLSNVLDAHMLNAELECASPYGEQHQFNLARAACRNRAGDAPLGKKAMHLILFFNPTYNPMMLCLLVVLFLISLKHQT